MKGKTLIQKAMHNWFWQFDSKRKNAKGKKYSTVKAEAKRANRTIRYNSKKISKSGY